MRFFKYSLIFLFSATLSGQIEMAENSTIDSLSYLPELEDVAKKHLEWLSAVQAAYYCDEHKTMPWGEDSLRYYQEKCNMFRAEYNGMELEKIQEVLLAEWKKSILKMGRIVELYKEEGHTYSVDDWHEARRIAEYRLYERKKITTN